MKYIRLTKEQLEELHHDFARFLASQQITSDEWETIKREKPHVAEEEIDIFSDLVWEKSLEKVKFLERIDSKSINCFYFRENDAQMISVLISINTVDLTTPNGFQWLENNIHSDKVQLYTGKKKLAEDRKLEIFDLIRQGVQVSDGKIFKTLLDIKKQVENK
ncbi:DUF6495 family protein [Capnocytophaga felis]|uniref:Histidyl-tRNA synthetase n=1 Tax=Capnocytophaga felis TaxID=2267611 RepID=A0A5M4BBC7_9FLAO|nr:DUF6495 family protein [Capnocytophaga felis]GET46869.1 hypothetical protein RCZ01_21710 [Capnocytophaga felis]GET48571.1 hypothetical protein RCZ02_14020 [Capnocytophaga felis]